MKPEPPSPPDFHLSHYRWPAEWEAHAATWVTWPVNADTWPGIFDRIPSAFARFIAALARFEPVCVVAENQVQAEARSFIDAACEASASSFPVTFVDVAVNDSWIRDYGPIFLNRRPDAGSGPPQVVLDWQYNSWGGKYPPWDRDAAAASDIAALLDVPHIGIEYVLEGGAVEGNGSGVVLTTDECLLNPSRNGDVTRTDMEDLLRRYLQADSVVWLPGRGIIGDDTDGHIDQVARFVNRDTLLLASAWQEDAPEAADLRANQLAAEDLQTVGVRLPSPKFQQEHRLPASYCNYCLVNGGVIVPTFRDAADDAALAILQTCFPDREIVGVDALDLVWGLGAFHCLSQQQPLADSTFTG